jgi:hypothetical protein
MGCRGAALDSADVPGRAFEVDLFPTKVDHLGRSQAMPEGEKRHKGVAVTMPIGRAASIPFSTSAGLRCSRVRSAAFLGRFEAPVRFTVAGVTSRRFDFAIIQASERSSTVQSMRIL